MGHIFGSARRSPARAPWRDRSGGGRPDGTRVGRARSIGRVSCDRSVVGRGPGRHASSAGVPRETSSPVGRARPEPARAAMMVPMDEVLIEGTDPRVREYLGDAGPSPRSAPRPWAPSSRLGLVLDARVRLAVSYTHLTLPTN